MDLNFSLHYIRTYETLEWKAASITKHSKYLHGNYNANKCMSQAKAKIIVIHLYIYCSQH
jgi:hypothetical protein